MYNSSFFVVFSNLIIIPAFLLSIVFKLFHLSSIIATVGTISTIYHLCQSNLICLFDSNIENKSGYILLQYSDMFFVNTILISFIMYLLEVKKKITISVIFILQGIFLLSILSGNKYYLAINSISIICGILISICYLYLKNKSIGINLTWFIISIIIIAIGLFFYIYAGDPNDLNYNTYHSLWHIFLMGSLFTLILSKETYHTLIFGEKIILKKI